MGSGSSSQAQPSANRVSPLLSHVLKIGDDHCFLKGELSDRTDGHEAIEKQEDRFNQVHYESYETSPFSVQIFSDEEQVVERFQLLEL